MKITIDKSVLLAPLKQILVGASSNKVSMILSCILLQIKGGNLLLVAGDSHFFIKTEIPAIDFVLKRSGGIAISAKEIVEAVSRMPSKPIDIDVDGTQVKLSSGKTKMQLRGLDPEEYPELPNQEIGSCLEIPGKELKDIVRKTVFAVSKKEAHAILTGVKASFTEQGVSFWACDRHRLAMVTHPIETELELETVISGEHLRKISSIISERETASVSIDETMIIITSGMYTVYARSLEGTYPHLGTLMNPKSQSQFSINRDELIEALERVRVTATTSSGGFTTRMRVENEEIWIESRNDNNEMSEDSVETSNFRGSPLRIGFDGRYVLEALQVIDADNISIRFPGGARDYIFISEGDESRSLYLIAPIIIKEEDWNASSQVG